MLANLTLMNVHFLFTGHLPDYWRVTLSVNKWKRRLYWPFWVCEWDLTVLSPVALWNRFEVACTSLISCYELALGAGSKFIPQNSPTVQLDTTLTQSHAANQQAPCPLFENGPPLKSCSTVTLYTGEVTPSGYWSNLKGLCHELYQN